MESVLTSIKKMLGITEEYEHFDSDIIMHINSVFMILTQLGVGPPSGFSIRDKTSTWKEFISDETKLQLVKSYMHMKVKLLFDPPLSSAVIASMEKMIAEAEWRLNVAAETDIEKSEDHESYDGEYKITPKAFDSQTLDTENKILERNIVITEVPYYEDYKVTFINTTNLGDTLYGVTPEEYDLSTRSNKFPTVIYDGRIAISTEEIFDPCTTKTKVSVMPIVSFDKADEVFFATIG